MPLALFLPFYCLPSNQHASGSSLKHLLQLWVFVDVYIHGILVKKQLQYPFVTFSLLKLGWNTDVVHSKQCATIAKMLFLHFLCQEKRGNGQHRRWTNKEKLEARVIIKTDPSVASSVSLIRMLCNFETIILQCCCLFITHHK